MHTEPLRVEVHSLLCRILGRQSGMMADSKVSNEYQVEEVRQESADFTIDTKAEN